jgi:hypothetical protein
MMVENKRNLAAPCGLYCGACVIYRANKRGDSESLAQIKEQFTELLSNLKEGQALPLMPLTKGGFDLARVQREIREEASMCCKGCLSDVLAIPCRICGIRECAQGRGLTNCSQCPDMPCQLVIDFNNDGMPHHGEALVNLERQKEIGIDAWLVEQGERWCCVQCGSPLSWYDVECPDCHTTKNRTFGSSPSSD